VDIARANNACGNLGLSPRAQYFAYIFKGITKDFGRERSFVAGRTLSI
jgi:hypothetical protein